MFPPPPRWLPRKVSPLPLLLVVILVVIMVMTMMVVVAVIMVMVMVILTAGVVRIGVELFDAGRLLCHIGKLGDEIDYLVLE
jgi:hypothetical protein